MRFLQLPSFNRIYLQTFSTAGCVLRCIVKFALKYNQFYGRIKTTVECFKYFGSLLTNDGRCTCEIKSRIAMAKSAFNKKKTLFTSKLDLNLRKKLIKCYIWSTTLYGAEIWTLRAADQKYLETF